MLRGHRVRCRRDRAAVVVGGQSGGTAGVRADQTGARRGRALRAQGRDQPGHPGHRHRPGPAQIERPVAGRAGLGARGMRRARRTPPRLGARRTDTGTAGGPDHVRAQNRRMADRRRCRRAPLPRGRRELASATWRRRWHPRFLGHQRHRRPERLRPPSRPGRARAALAHAARPGRRGRDRARRGGRCARQDRHRRDPVGTDGDRRGCRTGGGGWLVDDAAQTQPDPDHHRARRDPPHARSGRHDPVGHACRARACRQRVAHRMGAAARTRRPGRWCGGAAGRGRLWSVG